MGRYAFMEGEKQKQVVITDVVKHIINAESLYAFLKNATPEDRIALCTALQNSSKELPKTPYHETLMQSYMQSVIHFMRAKGNDGLWANRTDVIREFIVEYMDFLLASAKERKR